MPVVTTADLVYTEYQLSATDHIECEVYHNGARSIYVLALANRSPVFGTDLLGT